jgi:hypothetical protein
LLKAFVTAVMQDAIPISHYDVNEVEVVQAYIADTSTVPSIICSTLCAPLDDACHLSILGTQAPW